MIVQAAMTYASGLSDGAVFVTLRNKLAASAADITKQAQMAEKVSAHVIPGWPINSLKNDRWTWCCEAAIQTWDHLCFLAGIRNSLNQEESQERSEPEALERHASLDVLARWVNGASVEAVS
ncbi:hypothetical protein [Nocardia sp. NPDC057227]|uniref:hypothetical protein n=1 Tax=Nocardia sp. NPDC057227 TaxID=3346056 RepID=UPI00363C2835